LTAAAPPIYRSGRGCEQLPGEKSGAVVSQPLVRLGVRIAAGCAGRDVVVWTLHRIFVEVA
jgi:hypothetical protein